MPGSWNIDVDGREHFVSVERGENNKDIIRINGRVAAKPLGAEERERGISVGGVPYTLTRKGDGFELVQDPWAVAPERNRAVAAAVLAHSEDTPLSWLRSVAKEKLPLLGWISIVAFVAIILVYATGDNYEELAGKRVDEVLREMRTADHLRMQFAVTVWAKNRRALDSQEMSWASDHFDKWQKEKGLYKKAFTDFEVLESKVLEDSPKPTAIVTFRIEKEQYRVRVPKDAPITWEN
jgi:hypothetical protein